MRFKEIVARLFGLAENCVARLIASHIDEVRQAAQHSGYRKGYEAGRTSGEQDGETSGHASGYEKGRAEGEATGHATGFAEGRQVWVIENHQTPTEPRPLESTVYGPHSFTFGADVEAKMRSEVAAAVREKKVPAPTEQQWSMIFAKHPATCVIAGAGSGKSTTLVLRVVFMLKHLRRQRDEITVVSFTRASCDELRETLMEVLPHWGIELDYSEAKRLVRTFHSMLFRVAKSAFPGVGFFENIRITKLENKGNIDRPDDEEDIDNPMSAAKLNDDQLTLINLAYAQLFAADEKFREHVLQMLMIECSRAASAERDDDKEYREGTIRSAAARDLRLVETVNARYRERALWPDGVEEGPFPAFKRDGRIFYANARTEHGRLVFFGELVEKDAAAMFSPEEQLVDDAGKAIFTLRSALKVKRNIVAVSFAGDYRYVNTRSRLDMLALERLWLSPGSRPIGGAPVFEVKLDGELKFANIAEAFYMQASFIESMGMRVPNAVKEMPAFRNYGLEFHFCSALPRYWLHFNELLSTKKQMTFNNAFLLLSSEQRDTGPRVPLDVLRPLTNLVIDEFQDISPQIVHWLVSCQRQLADTENPDKFPTLMAIGDDWQAIYGWRGSAPEFFIKFDSHFPAHPQVGPALKVQMVENFRSVEPIIRDAERLLGSVVTKTIKSSVATQPLEHGDHGVKLFECGELSAEKLSKIAAFIEEQLEYVKSLPKSHKNKVIVMSRTNTVIDKLKALLEARAGILFYTYHRAKGLQAEVAVMIEDCSYDQVHKLRNRVYVASGLFDVNYTYDMAALDEAYRLAYVGATRGRRRTFWFVDSVAGASAHLLNVKSQTGLPARL
ncbi:UvrD-helicase domain-containing protein [Pandoraea terrigena]|uniref:DNA helicase n=1 Tax=Pandoraea terrigena TaxID=2508292 RepID=A0A5E4WAG4_9BURK|nr:UvrD-helicase domain-containing protein [Pandoraea terrigena]VVE20095.1 DNA helicase [Pandoraea terrigena]